MLPATASAMEPSAATSFLPAVSGDSHGCLLDLLGERIVVARFNNTATGICGSVSGSTRDGSQRMLSRWRIASFSSRGRRPGSHHEKTIERERTDVVYIGNATTLDGLPSAVERAPSGLLKLDGVRPALPVAPTTTHKEPRLRTAVACSVATKAQLGRRAGIRGSARACRLLCERGGVVAGTSPKLAERVADVAAVEEGEKRWLLCHAALMIYPSVHGIRPRTVRGGGRPD